ncbi:MAG: dynamin family protein [Thiothrix sp.]|nr:dynamin family protein [Thiothrix sp.]HPQ95314.1 dynamin family protein [Thiolinea sp.]
MTPAKRMDERLKRLQEHLKRENPVLVDVVDKFRGLDRIAIKLGLLADGDSYATQISWWPMIAVMGTFSAGKSSFINTYLGLDLQRTGNQAVDDKFTVITFSPDGSTRTLPGLALDGDPRFPFYQISEEIERVTAGEGAKIDNYLQMKVTPSEVLRGRILIDSPGFDADEQRKSTLRITDHIIQLSDLVLVFFDARHPEPGAMQDTLEHLVKGSQRRSDSSKFLFILNQIDTSAREDNLEDIVSSWQKSLVQAGMSTGNFYVLFNDRLVVPAADEAVWARYVAKRDADFKRIDTRIRDVNTDRAYRITGSMESLANQIEQQAVPHLTTALKRWRKDTLIWDAIAFSGIVVGLGLLSVWLGWWAGLRFNPPWLGLVQSSDVALGIAIAVPVLLLLLLHFWIRAKVAGYVGKTLPQKESFGNLLQAFRKNTRFPHLLLSTSPAGWNPLTRSRLSGVRDSADRFVQSLNDRFTNPSGQEPAAVEKKA